MQDSPRKLQRGKKIWNQTSQNKKPHRCTPASCWQDSIKVTL